MTQDRPHRDEARYSRFIISAEYAASVGASLPNMIADRMGYLEKQALEEPPAPNSDIQPLIDLIVSGSSQQQDYLLPDTPLKEALFRLMLAEGNRPISADELSETLSSLWAMSAYPRNLSPYVINRLLEHSSNYCIVPVDEPEDAPDGE